MQRGRHDSFGPGSRHATPIRHTIQERDNVVATNGTVIAGQGAELRLDFELSEPVLGTPRVLLFGRETVVAECDNTGTHCFATRVVIEDDN